MHYWKVLGYCGDDCSIKTYAEKKLATKKLSSRNENRIKLSNCAALVFYFLVRNLIGFALFSRILHWAKFILSVTPLTLIDLYKSLVWSIVCQMFYACSIIPRRRLLQDKNVIYVSRHGPSCSWDPREQNKNVNKLRIGSRPGKEVKMLFKIVIFFP